MHSIFGDTCLCESTYIFYDEASQISTQKSNGRRNTGRQSPTFHP